MNHKGLLVSFEGIDGAGKTSIISYLNRYLPSGQILNIREPGGTRISEEIRSMLLNVKNDNIRAETEALLYAAARSQVVKELIRPALQEGKIVLADRFIDSTIAYQGYGRHLDKAFLNHLNHFATGGLRPDLTIPLDLAPEQAFLRNKGIAPDRIEIEGIGFLNKVREGYLDIAREEPERVKVINAGEDLERVVEQVSRYLNDLIRLDGGVFHEGRK